MDTLILDPSVYLNAADAGAWDHGAVCLLMLSKVETDPAQSSAHVHSAIRSLEMAERAYD